MILDSFRHGRCALRRGGQDRYGETALSRGSGGVRRTRRFRDGHAIHLERFSSTVNAQGAPRIQQGILIGGGGQNAEKAGAADEGLLVAEEDRLFAHGDGAWASANRHSAYRGRGGCAQGCTGLGGGIRALVERFFSCCQLHGKRQAGGVAALAAIRIGKELEDLQAGQWHVAPPNQQSICLRSRASDSGWRRTKTSAPASMSVSAVATSQWTPPPLTLTSLAFQASSPTRQIMGELSMASPPRAASRIRSITE